MSTSPSSPSQPKSKKTAVGGTGSWTADEHQLFLVGLYLFGKGDWTRMARTCIPTRSPAQVASHAQKFFLHHERGSHGNRTSIHDETQADPRLVAKFKMQAGLVGPVAGDLDTTVKPRRLRQKRGGARAAKARTRKRKRREASLSDEGSESEEEAERRRLKQQAEDEAREEAAAEAVAETEVPGKGEEDPPAPSEAPGSAPARASKRKRTENKHDDFLSYSSRQGQPRGRKSPTPPPTPTSMKAAPTMKTRKAKTAEGQLQELPPRTEEVAPKREQPKRLSAPQLAEPPLAPVKEANRNSPRGPVPPGPARFPLATMPAPAPVAAHVSYARPEHEPQPFPAALRYEEVLGPHDDFFSGDPSGAFPPRRPRLQRPHSVSATQTSAPPWVEWDAEAHSAHRVGNAGSARVVPPHALPPVYAPARAQRPASVPLATPPTATGVDHSPFLGMGFTTSEQEMWAQRTRMNGALAAVPLVDVEPTWEAHTSSLYEDGWQHDVRMAKTEGMRFSPSVFDPRSRMPMPHAPVMSYIARVAAPMHYVQRAEDQSAGAGFYDPMSSDYDNNVDEADYAETVAAPAPTPPAPSSTFLSPPGELQWGATDLAFAAPIDPDMVPMGLGLDHV